MSEIIWSWSRLNTYHSALEGDGCFHLFNQQYNIGNRGENNYFAEYGTLVHEMTERLHNGSLIAWDIEDELKRGLKNFHYKVPFQKMRASYENSLFKFFDEFEDVFKDYTITQAEELKNFEVDKIKLKGFPDMFAHHREYGKVIGDYKTSRVYDTKKMKHNIMQLYLYSIPYYNEFGVYPDNLVYIFPREKENRERVFKFEIEELERTKQWVRDTVCKVLNHKDTWMPRCKTVDGKKDFFASQLCNLRNQCAFRYSCVHRNEFTPY
ncbi:PD-(D/E)XK nuclease family protein [Paenibacillus chitinolyticus]|uniref:PD-(D/E)XK nuclease family protein n=1 Tax=Paenibacillus chitinolyticus TaxID=79263 RepID=UPI00366BF2E8